MRNRVKWLRRNWCQFLKYAIGVLIIAGGIWAGVILYQNDNWLGISAIATLLLALGAFLTIRQNYRLHKKDRQERLVNEIIHWAEEINEISLAPDIQLTSANVQLMKKQREANELLRYGISMSRVISIETIASEGFKNELLDDVQKVANTLAKFICIRQLKSLGVLPTEEGMPGKAREEIKQEVEEGKESVDQIWKKYATELSDRIRELLTKANIIKASLLK